MSSQEAKYNIKAVSTLLGIPPGTLRAWERRYKMIAPTRNESGHRLYTEENIKILKWLMNKVNKGFSISQAVKLLENNQVSIHNKSKMNSNNVQKDYSIELMDELLQSLMDFEESQANDLLNKAFTLYTVDKVVIELLGTLLNKMDDQREIGQITSAHEQFASSFLRSRIGMILHTLPVGGFLPKVMAVCGPDETHELSLLIFTLFLRNKGFKVIYIGAGIVEDDIETVIEQVKPEFLFLSCTLDRNLKKTLDLIDDLSSKYRYLQIGLGGKAFSHTTSPILTSYDKYMIGDNKQQWEKWLKEKLGH